MGVIPGKGILPKYLYFYFLNIDMRQLGSGSSIPQINNYDIEPWLSLSLKQKGGKQKSFAGLRNCPPKPNAWNRSISASWRRWRS